MKGSEGVKEEVCFCAHGCVCECVWESAWVCESVCACVWERESDEKKKIYLKSFDAGKKMFQGKDWKQRKKLA